MPIASAAQNQPKTSFTDEELWGPAAAPAQDKTSFTDEELFGAGAPSAVAQQQMWEVGEDGRPTGMARFKANFGDGWHRGTLAGAGADFAMSDVPGYKENEMARRAAYDAMPDAEGFVENLQAFGGQLLGGALTPESAASLPIKAVGLAGKGIGWLGEKIVGKLAGEAAGQAAGRVATRAGTNAAEQAIINPVTDVPIQGIQIAGGYQEEYDPIQTVLSIPLGVAIGGTIGTATGLGSEIRSAFADWRAKRNGGQPVATDPTPDEVSEFMASPDLAAFMDANGIKDNSDPRVQKLKDALDARRAAEAERTPQDMLTVDPAAPRIGQTANTAAARARVELEAAARRREEEQAMRDEEAAAQAAQLAREGQTLPPPAPPAAPTPLFPSILRVPDETPRPAVEAPVAMAPVSTLPPDLAAGLDRARELEAQGKQQSADAFTLADRQRGRAIKGGQGTRDTQTAGRPDGVAAKDVVLYDGLPVQVLDIDPEKGLATVQQYDPRTDEPIPGTPPLKVPASKLKTARYADNPRGAQDFSARARTKGNIDTRGRGPDALPGQTFRITERDPNRDFPGAPPGGSDLSNPADLNSAEGRSPLPPNPNAPSTAASRIPPREAGLGNGEWPGAPKKAGLGQAEPPLPAPPAARAEPAPQAPPAARTEPPPAPPIPAPPKAAEPAPAPPQAPRTDSRVTPGSVPATPNANVKIGDVVNVNGRPLKLVQLNGRKGPAIFEDVGDDIAPGLRRGWTTPAKFADETGHRIDPRERDDSISPAKKIAEARDTHKSAGIVDMVRRMGGLRADDAARLGINAKDNPGLVSNNGRSINEIREAIEADLADWSYFQGKADEYGRLNDNDVGDAIREDLGRAFNLTREKGPDGYGMRPGGERRVMRDSDAYDVEQGAEAAAAWEEAKRIAAQDPEAVARAYDAASLEQRKRIEDAVADAADAERQELRAWREGRENDGYYQDLEPDEFSRGQPIDEGDFDAYHGTKAEPTNAGGNSGNTGGLRQGANGAEPTARSAPPNNGQRGQAAPVAGEGRVPGREPGTGEPGAGRDGAGGNGRVEPATDPVFLDNGKRDPADQYVLPGAERGQPPAPVAKATEPPRPPEGDAGPLFGGEGGAPGKLDRDLFDPNDGLKSEPKGGDARDGNNVQQTPDARAGKEAGKEGVGAGNRVDQEGPGGPRDATRGNPDPESGPAGAAKERDPDLSEWREGDKEQSPKHHKSADQLETALIHSLDGKSIPDALKMIGERAPNPVWRTLANMLVRVIEHQSKIGSPVAFGKVEISNTNKRLDGGASGVTGTTHDLRDKKISVDIIARKNLGWDGTPAANIVTILHEAIHAVTSHLVDGIKYKGITSGPAFDAYRALNKLFKAVEKQIEIRKQFGLKAFNDFELRARTNNVGNAMADVEEFMAWGMTHRGMQDFLEILTLKDLGIREPGSGSVWSKFIEHVRDLMGLPVQSKTALKALMEQTAKMMEHDYSVNGHGLDWPEFFRNATKRRRRGPRRSPEISGDTNVDGAVDAAIDSITRTNAERLGPEEKQGIGAVAKDVISTMYDPKHFEGLGGVFKTIGARAGQLARMSFYRNDAMIRAMAERYDSPTMKWLADQFHSLAGDTGSATGRTYHEAVARQAGVWQTELSRILDGMDDNQVNAIYDLMVNPGKNRGQTAEEKAAKSLAKLLDEIHDYRVKASEDIGYVKGGYVPRVANAEAVAKDADFFQKQVTRLYREAGLDPKTAEAKAQAYTNALLLRDMGLDNGGKPFGVDIDPTGVARSSEQARVFGKNAEKLLDGFLEKDLRTILTSYVVGGVRRAEHTRRFGMPGEVGSKTRKDWIAKHGQKTQLEVAVDKIRDEIRASGKDVAGIEPMEALNAAYQSNLNILGASTSRTVRGTVDFMHVVNIIGRLPFAVVSSIPESAGMFMRTRSFQKGVGHMLTTFKEFGKSLSHMEPSEARRTAEAAGIVTDALLDNLIQARMTGTETQRGQRALSRFTRATLNHQWTEGVRTSATKYGAQFISELATDVGKGGRKGARAEGYLRELGVENPKEFAAHLGKHGVPSLEDIAKDKGAAATYVTALSRFVNQTAISPTRANRPGWTSHPLGSLIFALQSYNYEFKAQVVDRTFRELKTAVNERDLFMGLGVLASTIPLLGMTYVVDTYLRPLITRSDRDFSKEQSVDTIMRVLDRAGATAAMSPLINAYAGTKYNRDLATSLAGPALAMPLDMAGAAIGAIRKAQEGTGTNTADRKLAQAAYRNVLLPMLNFGMAGINPLGLSTAGIWAVSQKGAERAFVDNLAGPQSGSSPSGGGGSRSNGRNGRGGRNERGGR